MKKDYNQEKELNRYIWQYYTDLMTDFEKEVGNAIVLLEKKTDNSIEKYIFVKTKEGTKDVSNLPEIREALKNGQMAFKKKVVHRILSEYRNAIAINQCSKCNSIVQTPKARLCLWCGHSWYDRAD